MTDDQDKEFDKYLAGGSRLSDAYADLPAAEPPTYLDYAIRDEAHRVVGAGASRGRPGVRERARAAASGSRAWQKWTMPLSVAATLFIVVIVAFQLPYITGQAPMPSTAPAEAPVAQPGEHQQQGGAAAKNNQVGPAGSGMLAKPAPRGAAAQQDSVQGNAGLNEMKPAPKPQPSADKNLKSYQYRKEKHAPPVARRVAPGVPPAAMEAAAPVAHEAARAPAPRQAPAPSAAGIAQKEGPRAWLMRIEKLKREGKQAEAKAALVAFRKRYPKYPLPEDLRDLE